MGLFALLILAGGPVYAQTPTIEFEQVAGYSTERVQAASSLVRVFGDLSSSWRFVGEAGWGLESGDSDAFNTAYPYRQRVEMLDAYVERVSGSDGLLMAARFGRYRTPFGISNASDQMYFGFQRAPLIRYDDNLGLSNGFFEQGADVLIGRSRASIEASIGLPGDITDSSRRTGFDSVLHAQVTAGHFIVGASYLRSKPYATLAEASGSAAFEGVDVRWMRSGVQLRGEWIAGRPFEHGATQGGYLDASVHRPAIGPFTVVARAERIAHADPWQAALRGERITAGAKVRLLTNLTAEADVVHQTPGISDEKRTALDIGIIYTLRRD